MKASASAILLIGGTLAALATECRGEVPRVETNVGRYTKGDWDQKHLRFRDIIPPERMHRIIRLVEGGFDIYDTTLPDRALRVQADYDALVAHLIASDEKASDYLSFGANEGSISRLLFVTTDNKVFEVEILSIGGPRIISSILINGEGISARFKVQGFNRKAPRK